MNTKILKRIAGIIIVALTAMTLAYSIGVFIGGMIALPGYLKAEKFIQDNRQLQGR